MKITFLGTGTSQGVPVIGCQCEVCTSLDFRDKRLRTSAQIEVNGLSIVIDSGPDFRQQVLVNRVNKLDALIFTHQHKDHIAGMDEVRSYNFLQNKPIPVYARPEVIDQLKQEFAYVFAEHKYPGIPQVDVHVIGNGPFLIEGIKIIPIDVLHYKLPVFGYRIQDLTYITDANYIAAREKEKIKGSKILVINALQQQEHISHFTLNQALEIIEEIKPECAYLVHISHRMGLHREVSKTLPTHVELAFDGLSVEI